MNERQAIARLKKLFGKKLAYQVDPKAPTADEREAIRIEYEAQRAKRDELKAAREARFAAVLAGDEEYQRLKAQTAAADERTKSLAAGLRSHRIAVGTVITGAGLEWFTVIAQADNWADAVAAVEAKRGH